MSRLIDADAIKRRAQKVATESWKMGIKAKIETVLNQFIDWIDEAPTTQVEPNWIPVTERLPEHSENNDYYLVTIQCEHVDGWDDYVVGIAEWTPHGWDILTGYIKQIKVVAWSELPEPYTQHESEVTECN